jgi:uncharacterized protein (DUF4213/DUF364 family)
MEKNRRIRKNILELTLTRLQKLYKDERASPGILVRFAVKPLWITLLGSNNECGIAANFTGIPNSSRDRAENIRFLNLIGKPLFDIADRGIHSADLMERSLGIAAINALSQPYLASSLIRDRGFLAQCWITGDKLVHRYPTISRLVTKNDIVAVIGYGNEVRSLRGRCRELHVTDIRPRETFETVIFDKTIMFGPQAIYIHSGGENEQILNAADVVFISASTLVNGTFESLLRWTRKARLVGLYGLGGSLIPDALFENGIDFITSFRISDPARFSDDVINDHDMEDSIRLTQTQFMFMRPLAETRGTPIKKMLRMAADI